MKTKSIHKYALLTILLTTALVTFGQGVPAEQWTTSERQFVENAKNLYQQQGISYTNEQAALAVQQMRQKQAPTQRGIPEPEWTPQEKNFVEATRQRYASKGMPFTTEQAQLTVQSMREKIANLTGTFGAIQAVASGAVTTNIDSSRIQTNQPNTGSLSEEQIAKEVSSWPRITEQMTIRGRRDGFDLNGRPILDSEGSMFSYAFDLTTGSITYAVKTSRGLTIKTIGNSPDAQPLVIATGVNGRSGWEFQTSTGKQLSGSTISILSNGFLVSRAGSAFRYQTGKGVQSIAIPDGYSITPLQRGNVGATGFILLEKDGAIGSENPVSGLFSSVKAIGSIIGVNRKEDYVLMSTTSGKLFPINISANGKQVTLMSHCRQVNWAVSECQQAQTFQSVYGVDGMKNNSHYYWLVNWVGTPTGPVAFTLEDGLGKLFITDLATGKKALGFDRSFGIADWTVDQSGDGRVAVKAKLAFDWKEIPDAVAFLNSGAM
jgi:hypothetical protein